MACVHLVIDGYALSSIDYAVRVNNKAEGKAWNPLETHPDNVSDFLDLLKPQLTLNSMPFNCRGACPGWFPTRRIHKGINTATWTKINRALPRNVMIMNKNNGCHISCFKIMVMKLSQPFLLTDGHFQLCR
jgi:hypothetical protein